MQTKRLDYYNYSKKYEELFDGTLGTFDMEPYNIELIEGATPYHLKKSIYYTTSIS